MKAYLNPHDRFANRMKSSLNKGKEGDEARRSGSVTDETKALFVDQSKIELDNNKIQKDCKYLSLTYSISLGLIH